MKRDSIRNAALFKEDQTTWLSHFKRSPVRLGQKPSSLYCLRHSGPSADWLHRRRSLVEIKKRGRWASDAS
eukprot:12407353-Karenia_brevis.AAC.1